jgi:SPP1 family predicted phage head-tail adaptor
MNFDAGRLRERITIRRQVNVKNARGGQDRSWTTVAANLSAEVVSLNGREAVIGHVLQGISTFEIRIRFRDDLKPADQIVWDARELNIHVAEDKLGTRQWTMIQASTLAPQGSAS